MVSNSITENLAIFYCTLALQYIREMSDNTKSDYTCKTLDYDAWNLSSLVFYVFNIEATLLVFFIRH